MGEAKAKARVRRVSGGREEWRQRSEWAGWGEWERGEKSGWCGGGLVAARGLGRALVEQGLAEAGNPQHARPRSPHSQGTQWVGPREAGGLSWG